MAFKWDAFWAHDRVATLASNRARECEMRLNSAGYEDIARVGDGINITLQATRTANEDGRVRRAFYTLRETQLPRIVPS